MVSKVRLFCKGVHITIYESIKVDTCLTLSDMYFQRDSTDIVLYCNIESKIYYVYYYSLKN